MSADMQKRGSTIATPTTIPPQAVSDRSIIDSVAGFINDVTSSNTHQGDPLTQILWIRFENSADISDASLGQQFNSDLLIILGYNNGIQVWAVPPNGEAVEVLSWRHGSVKCLKILPTPLSNLSEVVDQYLYKRPLIAICESSVAVGTGPQYLGVSFVSLKDGDQVKNIKFKSPVVDILANRMSIIITFSERIAVFDAKTLEDRLTITTCQIGPNINPNPVALGSRWLAYSERKLHSSKRSSGGFEGEGSTSYTATVLNAAKTLGKGLRGLGEQVAAGLTGSSSSPPSLSFNISGNCNDNSQYGIVTVLDIRNPIKEQSPTSGNPISINGSDPVVAHFVAHYDPIVAMAFDNSGMLLLTADKKGHNFNLFRIHPHPIGASLAAVHHLYTLHRGDTTAKVQDIVFSLDSRWIAVSTLRGTTHIFAITPYGGPVGIRTHGSYHVVNRLSRFHRSAGLTADGRSNSPVNFSESNTITLLSAYSNPRVPPFPNPTLVLPLAQIRQPQILQINPNLATLSKGSVTRQRSSSGSEDTHYMRVTACFAKDRSWLLEPPSSLRDAPLFKSGRKAADSLFIMGSHGALIQYDIDPKPATSVPKEKISDETPLELAVEAKAQWILLRKEISSSSDLIPPLPADNVLLSDVFMDKLNRSAQYDETEEGKTDKWLSQVEIITHAGPHRRLWMGPQFTFRTYNVPSGSSLSCLDEESVEICTATCKPKSLSGNMPIPVGGKSLAPITIESGSSSSYEQSPRLSDAFKLDQYDAEHSIVHGELQIKEDLADAMRESPSVVPVEAGDSSSNSSCYGSTQNLSTIRGTINIVNPLGTVTRVTDDQDLLTNANLNNLHENCDETLFRPFVTVVSTNSENKVTDREKTNRKKDSSNLTSLGTIIIPIMEQDATFSNNPLSNKPNKSDKVKKEKLIDQNKTKTIKHEYVFEEKTEIVRKKKSSKPEILEASYSNKTNNNKKRNRTNERKASDETLDFTLNDAYKTDPLLNKSLTSIEENQNVNIKEPKPDCNLSIEQCKSADETINLLNTLDLQFPSLEPLEPLDSFVDTLDKLNLDDTLLQEKSLTNAKCVATVEKNTEDAPTFWKNLKQEKLIFAMCTSLKEEQNEVKSEANEQQEGQDSDYKSLETEESSNVNELVETCSGDTTSSDDNTENSGGIEKIQEEDDEELRPLIKNTANEFNVFDDTPSSDTSCPININDNNTPTHTTSTKKRSKKRRK